MPNKQFKMQFRPPKTSKQDQVQSTHGEIVSCRSPGGKKNNKTTHLLGGFNQPPMEKYDVSQNGNLKLPQIFGMKVATIWP